jgi:Co/Zn/Cd efflux system component
MLAKHRNGEIHLRASFIFSTNDVLANLGVIVGGVLVAATGSRLPDLAIGAAVVLLVLRGGLRIVRDASRERGLRPDESAA